MISVIIPFFNHHEGLKQSLRTLAAQTEKDIEVIVVDDGSVEPLMKETVSHVYPRPFTLIREENAGAPRARNAGFQMSRGDYVIFWDADVIGEPAMLETMLTALKNHPEASFAYSDHFGSVLMKARPWGPNVLDHLNYIHSTSLLRRSAVIHWDESLKRFQDWDYWLTLQEQGRKGVYIPQTLFSVIPRKTGMSAWLPSFAYKKPFRFLPWWKKQVDRYFEAREVIVQKHKLSL